MHNALNLLYLIAQSILESKSKIILIRNFFYLIIIIKNEQIFILKQHYF
jgi:hypothetical protein